MEDEEDSEDESLYSHTTEHEREEFMEDTQKLEPSSKKRKR